MKKKKLLLFLILVLIVIPLIFFSSEIGELFLYFDSQNVTTLNNFLVTKEEILSHNGKNQNLIDTRKISLELSVDMPNEQITGKENITFSIKRNCKPVFNFSRNMKVKHIKLGMKKIKFTQIGNLLRLDTLLSANKKEQLSINYEGKPEKGLFFYSKDSAKYLFSINEPISAPGWFMCNDTPKDKFFFSISASVDSGYNIISNGKKIHDSFTEGKRRVVWETSYPIASYLTALYVGKYSETSRIINSGNNALQISVYSYPSDAQLAEKSIPIVNDAINRLGKYFGEFPFIKDKFAIVEIPWNYGGIENQTAIGIGENYFRSPEMFAELFVHETAHEWWGNSVGIDNWDDVWIDEGMANYSEALYWKDAAGEKAFNSTMQSMLRNALEKGKIRGREKGLFADIVYDKSAWIFRMLNYELGDSLFYKSLKKYILLYKYKTGNAGKLKEVFENTSDKNLKRFFSQWIWGESGFIELNCNYFIDKNLSEINIRVQQTSDEKYSFLLPIHFYDKKDLILKKNFRILSADTTITIKKIECDSVTFDPNHTLLREEIGK